MKIFLSYASKYHEIAVDLCCRLQAVGHEVFFDREDLPAGASFDDRIHSAIESSELFIFLISPESVEAGRYTRTELKIASRKWPTPGWHVLPVQLVETPLADVPAYLRALTIMQAEGNLTAEIVLEVQQLANSHGQEKPQQQSHLQASKANGLNYRPVHIRFSRTEGGSYSITVPDEKSNNNKAENLLLDSAQLEQALWSGARSIDGSARRSSHTNEFDSLLPASANAREIGQVLYNTLFNSPLRNCLEECLGSIDPQRGEGLRFVINTTEAPDLACLPWEFLYSPVKDDFLFSDRMKPVVRWLDVDEPPPVLSIEPPLRILMAIAAPTDRQDLQVGKEISHLDRALEELTDSGQVETVRLDHATLESLDNALLQIQPHILHFIGHGDFLDNEGLLILESDSSPGTSDSVSGRQLAVLLRNHLSSLRMVFLNSCMGATASRATPFGGVAQSLIRRGIPAVIAMQFPIPDKAAIALARHFYRYLAAGQPVDAALTSARAFLYARGYSVEWGAPALHMRTPDGRLFDIAPTPPKPIQTLPADAAPAANDQQSSLPSHKSKRYGPLILLCISILFLTTAGTGLWLYFSGNDKPLPVEIRPQKNHTDPKPDPIKVVDPVDQVMAHLQSKDYESAVELLEELLSLDRTALSAEQLGVRRNSIILALVNAIEKKIQQDDNESAYQLLNILKTMAPFDPGVEAQFPDMVDLLLHGHDLSNPEPEPAAAGQYDHPTYTIRTGDTLWLIARRLLGAGHKWQQLVTFHNQKFELGFADNRINNPQHIVPGQKILIPYQVNAIGSYAINYYVSRGESLSSIALRIYKDPQMWQTIYQDNAASISNPDLIYPGQVLQLRQ